METIIAVIFLHFLFLVQTNLTNHRGTTRSSNCKSDTIKYSYQLQILVLLYSIATNCQISKKKKNQVKHSVLSWSLLYILLEDFKLCHRHMTRSTNLKKKCIQTRQIFNCKHGNLIYWMYQCSHFIVWWYKILLIFCNNHCLHCFMMIFLLYYH